MAELFGSDPTGKYEIQQESNPAKWTDTDLQEFAEWCSWNGWIFVLSIGMSTVDYWEQTKYLSYKTTSKLREQWEIETGRRNSNENTNI